MDPAEDGLCGNDDAGQMSAWYVFSSLGFYPVTPGSEYYAVGSPLVKSAQIQLPNGKKLDITVENQSPQNIYVQEITLNGKVIQHYQLKHSELINGGTLVYYMERTPNKQ